MNPVPINKPFPLFHAACRVCGKMQPSTCLAADCDQPFTYVCVRHWSAEFQEAVERDYAGKFKKERADVQAAILATARREASPKHGPVV